MYNQTRLEDFLWKYDISGMPGQVRTSLALSQQAIKVACINQSFSFGYYRKLVCVYASEAKAELLGPRLQGWCLLSPGSPIRELGFTIMPLMINNINNPSVDSSRLKSRGFLYIKQTFQCVQHLTLPPAPYLFAVYIHSNELTWARAFPLRLMFRLGAEFRYYPCPLVSNINRSAVYGEVGHTIMNLLVDFRNFQYTLNKIDDLVIHVEEKKTTVIVPAYNLHQVKKVISNSDEHVVAISGNFSSMADSHLVCLQTLESNYQTQAINIQGRPRSVTGASFIVFNGALKPSLGIRAKSSIIEDGLMVQLTPDDMTKLKQALLNATSFTIKCGLVKLKDLPHDDNGGSGSGGGGEVDDVVEIKWMLTRPDKTFDIRSPIDGLNLSNSPCVKLHNNNSNKKHLHKSTKLNCDVICVCLYYLHKGHRSSGTTMELSSDVELEKLVGNLILSCRKTIFAELSKAECLLHTRVHLRVHVGMDQIGYETGTNSTIKLSQSCLFTLDDTVIPLLHQSGISNRSSQVDLEMVFVLMKPIEHT